MKNNILVTIIIPIYNSKDELERCIESVINQTYKNLEIILVDDGSTDNSFDICKEYTKIDNRIKVLSQENKGVSSARNLGLDNAKGQKIVFIDSDDEIHPYMIERLIELNNKNKDVVICNVKNVSQKNEYSSNLKSVEIKEDNKWDVIEKLQKENLFNSPVNKIYDKNLIDKYNIRFKENMKLGEDYRFNLDYFEKCENGYYTEEALYFYIKNSKSATSKNIDNDFYKQIINIDYNVELYKRHGRNEKNLYYKYINTYRDSIAVFLLNNPNKNKCLKYIKMCSESKQIKKVLQSGYQKDENKIIYHFLKKKQYNKIYKYIKLRNFIKKIYYKMRLK